MSLFVERENNISFPAAVPRSLSRLGADRSRWRRVKFGDAVTCVNASTRNPLEDGFTRYVGLEHLDPEQLHLSRWGSVSEGTTFTRVFRAGQVLFGKRRAYQRKAAVADFDGICSGDILVFDAKTGCLLPELLPFIVQSDGFFDKALGTSAGSLSPRTKWSELAQYEFDLPPLDEQRRIAEVLWATENVKAQLSEASIGCDTTRAAVLEGSFASKDTMPLSSYCERNGIQIGPFGSDLHAHEYVFHGVGVVMPYNMGTDTLLITNLAYVTEEKAVLLQTHRLREGDILLPRRGELDRRGFVRKENVGWLCGTGSIRIRVKSNINPRAVFCALSCRQTVDWLQTNAVGTTMSNLNRGIVASIPIHLPPPADIAQVIASLHEIEQFKDAVQQHLVRTKQLQEKLFTQLLGMR